MNTGKDDINVRPQICRLFVERERQNLQIERILGL